MNKKLTEAIDAVKGDIIKAYNDHHSRWEEPAAEKALEIGLFKVFQWIANDKVFSSYEREYAAKIYEKIQREWNPK